jgi:hypothetical protein
VNGDFLLTVTYLVRRFPLVFAHERPGVEIPRCSYSGRICQPRKQVLFRRGDRLRSHPLTISPSHHLTLKKTPAADSGSRVHHGCKKVPCLEKKRGGRPASAVLPPQGPPNQKSSEGKNGCAVGTVKGKKQGGENLGSSTSQSHIACLHIACLISQLPQRYAISRSKLVADAQLCGLGEYVRQMAVQAPPVAKDSS